MSTQNIRRCDSCDNVVVDGEELWTIGVVAICNANPKVPYPQQFNRQTAHHGNNKLLKDHFKDYCRPCMTERGLIVAPNEEPAKEPDTLDDLLREIVGEMVEDRVQEGF